MSYPKVRYINTVVILSEFAAAIEPKDPHLRRQLSTKLNERALYQGAARSPQEPLSAADSRKLPASRLLGIYPCSVELGLAGEPTNREQSVDYAALYFR